MRWSVIRIIWFRELRDQLRDRRTVFMMAVLPLVLYPAIGFAVMQFALAFMGKPSVIGVYGGENLPAISNDRERSSSPDAVHAAIPQAQFRHAPELPTGANPLIVAGWWTATPRAVGGNLDQILAAAALVHLGSAGLGQDLPPVLIRRDGRYRFAPAYVDSPRDQALLKLRLLDWTGPGVTPDGMLRPGYEDWPSAIDRSLLDTKQVDLLLIVPPDFYARLETGDRPPLYLLSREGDDRSRMVNNRVYGILSRWKKRIKEVRLLRQGLPPSFDEAIQIHDGEKAKSAENRAAEELFDILVRVFPFVLVMWALAGALYPAVDLCAGEKERGTMETLLISPASREEIVWGKFLTIWVFSAATALLNLASMGVTAAFFGGVLPQSVLGPASACWCVVFVLPLAAFFSAICLSVGAYARSTKEGQYYLMPLFLLTMPLIFLTLAPGVELSPFYSMIPVTGVALLLQKLLAAASFEQTPWLYFLPVLAPLVLYGWFALRWAIEQFKREEVLFREAERLDLGLWLRNLFRDKEALPSTGQAVFCFVLIVLLHWIGFGFGGRLPLLGRNGVAMLGFVATPTLFMALQLTTQPGRALGLRWPAPRYFLSAGLLAFLLLPLLSELTLRVLRSYPGLMELLADHNPLTAELRFLGSRTRSPIGWWEALQYLLVLAVLPAACEELTFRGFILTGLRRRFSTGMAIVFSSLLFALYHFNVFQFVPALVLGLILGLLAVRTGSVLPGMLFHFIHNSTLLGMVILQGTGLSEVELRGDHLLWPIGLVACSLLGLLVILRLAKQSIRDPGAGDEMGTIQGAPTTATAGLAAASGQR